MAVYYYYAAPLAKIAPAGLAIETADGRVAVQRLAAEDLLQHQRDDGSWVNPASATREDEALVATSFAVIALAH